MIRNMSKWYQFHAGTQGRLARQLKRNIEKLNSNLFFIKNIASVSAQAKFYLLQVDIDQSDPVTMIYYGVYRFQWYIRHHEDCTKHPIMAYRFLPEIMEMHQNSTLGKI